MNTDRSPIREPNEPAPPLVSVVVPTHRRAELLAQCVGSILGQTLSEIQLVVVVDGTDPATAHFLSTVDDARLVHVTHPEPSGVSNARNTGIGLATGQWVAFCDDDDVWAPTKLAAQLAALRANPSARWAIAGAIRVHPDLGTAAYPEPPAAEAVAATLPHLNSVPGGCSGVLADRRLVNELGGFDPRLSTLADYDLWIRLNWRSAVAVAAEPLVGYRDHGGAMTRRIRNLEDEVDLIREKYRAELAEAGLPFPDDMFYVWTYRRTFRAGDWAGGLALLVRSSRFRVALARWLWCQAMYRLGLARAAGPPQPRRRSVTVSEFPWLAPILGPASECHSVGHTDMRDRQWAAEVVGEGSSVA